MTHRVSRPLVRMDASPEILMADRSLREELWGAEWIAGRMKESDPTNLTPLQAKQLERQHKESRRKISTGEWVPCTSIHGQGLPRQ
jgi:hypothetical protein